MSTTLLTAVRRQNTSIHPPDTEDRQILTIPDHDDRRQLALADRLSLRVALWLLERSLRTEPAEETDAPAWHERRAERQRLELARRQQAITLLTYDLQRRIL